MRPFLEVIFLLIDSVKRLLLGHSWPSPVEVVVYGADVADQNPDDDPKNMPFYLWEILASCSVLLERPE